MKLCISYTDQKCKLTFDSGATWSLRSASKTPITVGEKPVIVSTGVKLIVPWNIDMVIRTRPALARRGVFVDCALSEEADGEEIQLAVRNCSGVPFDIYYLDRIALVTFYKVPLILLEEVADLQ